MLKELFLGGFSIKNFENISTKEELEVFNSLFNNIKFSKEIEDKILNLNEEIKIVASVETWCPYARAFTATLKKASELNANIKLSFMTMGRGLMELADILNIHEDDFVVPTVAVLDKNYKLKNSFIGYPKKYAEKGLGLSKLSYFKGEKADEIIRDIF